ncbi:hypothetical protein VNO78_07442 [Psophocarpus tetragonolobus]|uniref:Uncharacterized protein n=1 Tax=Psophocarpus tetragonolobus TaxID=3891 RepID=A0AAN9XRP4_PSOTE
MFKVKCPPIIKLVSAQDTEPLSRGISMKHVELGGDYKGSEDGMIRSPNLDEERGGYKGSNVKEVVIGERGVEEGGEVRREGGEIGRVGALGNDGFIEVEVEYQAELTGVEGGKKLMRGGKSSKGGKKVMKKQGL